MANTAQIEKFIAIVGLPRSGTTILTALLDAHPEICLYYEPWNSSKKSRPPIPSSTAAFCALMHKRFGIPLPPEATVTGFKETTILPESTSWAVETLAQVSKSTPTQVVWIFRDPIHCLFSKIEGARRWWGYPNAGFSKESFRSFLRDTGPSFVALRQLVERYRGAIVRYEALVSEPEGTLSELMKRIGRSFVPEQLDYYLAGPRPDKVMGDPELARDPKPVSAAAVGTRQKQKIENAAVIEEVMASSEFSWIRGEFERLASLDAVAGPAD